MSGTNSSINNTLKLPLKGLVTSTNSAITSTDRVIDAFGKLQAQITSVNTGTGKLSANQTWSGVNTFSAATNSFSNLLGIATTAPTHSLTLSSTSTGWTHYNTSDQTTNFERVRGHWNSNAYELITEQSGTGQPRALILGGGGSYFSISNSGSNGYYNFSRGSGISQSAIGLTGGISGFAAGFANGISLTPTINQSGTAGYRGIFVSPFEQTTGSGSKLLLDLGTNSAANGGGTHTSRFSVSSIGEGSFRVGSNNGFNINADAGFNPAVTISLNGTVHAAFGYNSVNNYIASFQLKPLDFIAGGVSVGRIFNTGNWFFGSSPVDAGFKLDVNGSSRVQGDLTSGGNVLIGTTTQVASSLLTLASTTKGFLPPRQNQAQRTAITSPAVGLMVYQTDATEGLYVYSSLGWKLLNWT